jgi:hypothetical protein
MKIKVNLLGLTLELRVLSAFLRYEEGVIQLLDLRVLEAVRATDEVPWSCTSKCSILNVEVYDLRIQPEDK